MAAGPRLSSPARRRVGHDASSGSARPVRRVLGRPPHRPDDGGVAGAPADLAGDRLADRLLARVGSRSSSARAVSSIPGVQKPHWSPWHSMNPRCTGSRTPSTSRCSTVWTSWPSAIGGEHGARLHRLAVVQDDAGAAVGGVAAPVRAGQAELVAEEVDQQHPRLDVAGDQLAVDRDRDLHAGSCPSRCRGRARGGGAEGTTGQLVGEVALVGLGATGVGDGRQPAAASAAGLGERLLVGCAAAQRRRHLRDAGGVRTRPPPGRPGRR